MTVDTDICLTSHIRNVITIKNPKMRYFHLLLRYSTKFPVQLPFREATSIVKEQSILKLRTHNLTFACRRNFSLTCRNKAKLYVDSENAYMRSLLPPISDLQVSWSPDKITPSEFDNFLNQNFRASTASDIVQAFEKVKDFCVANNINLSDHRFDNLVDGLMDNCEKLSDSELLKLLLILMELPPCEASNSHNFHDMWSCLDDVCCWKMQKWSLEKIYSFVEVWYLLHLGRLTDFVSIVIEKAAFKPHRLSKNMLLYTFFYYNVVRNKQVPFELDHEVSKRVGEFSAEELAVIAMGYFKTSTKVKNERTMSAMVRAVHDQCGQLNEIILTALLKTIRLSQRIETAEEIYPMLEKVTEQIPRLSNAALIHVALTGTTLQVKHSPSILKSSETILKHIQTVRAKDIERILLALSMFDLDTIPSFFETAYTEIHKHSRRPEFAKYNRCLVCILNYLSLRNIYSDELLNRVLDPEYVIEVYGKPARNIPRELFSLDACVEIECPAYRGNRLTPIKKYKAAKWLSEYVPSHSQVQRLSLADRAYLEIGDALVGAVGDERLVRHDHVLPHFSKPDMILCKDRLSGKFVEPFGFEAYVLGDVKRPHDLDKYQWLALVLVTPNGMVRGEFQPLGSVLMKERQLKVIGYEPHLVYSVQFSKLTPEGKLQFLLEILHGKR